ncbi:hypothetical protein EVAR_103543_1 [Eumeta japonica]|uniref:Uncharacterized protein n=1 Tax=Eumeta variegata TaxID=151549 RepID=A0A4C1YI33_EUMVA|nr:hypothetical protein EVAR_103543_1 [Eumeta japonica]
MANRVGKRRFWSPQMAQSEGGLSHKRCIASHKISIKLMYYTVIGAPMPRTKDFFKFAFGKENPSTYRTRSTDNGRRLTRISLFLCDAGITDCYTT